MAIDAFSNLSVTISDGGTVPSLDYLPTKTYVDIGSGNVLKISWSTPTAVNNAVDSYKVYILYYESSSDDYKVLYSKNVGNLNELYVKSSLFAAIPQSFIPVQIYVEAISKYGTMYNHISSTYAVNVSRGCGTYVKVTEGYPKPIMKRALAFARLAFTPLVDEAGNPMIGADGNVLFGKVSSMQDDITGWTLMQNFYTKGDVADTVLLDANGKTILDANDRLIYADSSMAMSYKALVDSNNNMVLDSAGRRIYIDASAIAWPTSDIRYEVLTDHTGEIITDMSDENIYVL
jgi:hypothetical protein